MRRKLLFLGYMLLVLAVGLGGLAGCSKSAEMREPAAAEAAEGVAEQEVETRGESVSTPTEGVVVSVMTPTTAEGVVEPAGSEGAGSTSEGETTSPEGEASTEGTTETGETEGGSAESGPTATTVLPTPEPEPTEAPAAGSSTKTVTHTVKQGETLNEIAIRYGTTTKAIVNANGLKNANQIAVGQKLKIPTSGGSSGSSKPGCRFQHTVKRGEWIWQIARVYGVSANAILAANGLTVQSGKIIQPGKVLCIP